MNQLKPEQKSVLPQLFWETTGIDGELHLARVNGKEIGHVARHHTPGD